MGHVVEEGCFGTVGMFRRVQCVHQMHPKNRFCSGMEIGNKSYFTYKRAEQGETLKKVKENYKLLWNMWKKYGRMGEKRKVVFKMLLNVQQKL